MKWLILVLLAAVTSSRAYAKDDPFVCVPGNNASKGVFTFEIWRALTIDQDTTLFRLCELSSKSFLMVKAKEGGEIQDQNRQSRRGAARNAQESLPGYLRRQFQR